MNNIKKRAEEIVRVEINQQNPSALVCVYGTLRRGNGNYRSLLEGKGEYLGTFRSDPAYTMYGRRAGFPVVVDKGDTSIEYEVFKVTDRNVLENLHSLEGCSGIPGNERNWYDISPITTPVGEGWMYVMHESNRSADSIIESGNWNDKNL